MYICLGCTWKVQCNDHVVQTLPNFKEENKYVTLFAILFCRDSLPSMLWAGLCVFSFCQESCTYFSFTLCLQFWEKLVPMMTWCPVHSKLVLRWSPHCLWTKEWKSFILLSLNSWFSCLEISINYCFFK